MRASEKIRQRGMLENDDDESEELFDTADEIKQLETDYHLSMEVLRSIVDLTFPDLEVREPYMATLKRKADDAIKRWQKRTKGWAEDESHKE